MKHILLVLAMAAAFAQQVEIKSGPLTGDEIKDLVKLLQSVEDSQKVAEPFMKKYQADLEKFNARKTEILKAHGCEFGQLTQAFQPTNCAYTPATKAKK